MSDSLQERVFLVFKEHLKLSDEVDRSSLIYNETDHWDSIGHMTIVAGLEEAFDCMMDTDDILDMSSFEKSVLIMGKYA